jgi:hypothetical protein
MTSSQAVSEGEGALPEAREKVAYMRAGPLAAQLPAVVRLGPRFVAEAADLRSWELRAGPRP